MTDAFAHIKRLYGESYRTHGDTPASLLTPKGRQELRFRAVDPFVSRPGVRILDYGCGLGYLYAYLHAARREAVYTGVDILPEFVAACRAKHPEAEFRVVEAAGDIAGSYDVVFASGVFNLRTHGTPAESKGYAFDRIERLYQLADEVLVCDFLSGFVDFEQPDAQHFSVGELAEFCVRRLGRRFQIRHDLLPYECTLVAWKDGRIRRPGNLYEVDA